MTFHYTRRGNGQQGYVPSNYVKDIEPAIVTTTVTKKVSEEVPVKIKKKETVKRRLRKQRTSMKRASVSRPFSSEFSLSVLYCITILYSV